MKRLGTCLGEYMKWKGESVATEFCGPFLNIRTRYFAELWASSRGMEHSIHIKNIKEHKVKKYSNCNWTRRHGVFYHFLQKGGKLAALRRTACFQWKLQPRTSTLKTSRMATFQERCGEEVCRSGSFFKISTNHPRTNVGDCCRLLMQWFEKILPTFLCLLHTSPLFSSLL